MVAGAGLRGSDPCVRDARRAFPREGLACLHAKSHARHEAQAAFDAAGVAQLKERITLTLRSLGIKPTCGRWRCWPTVCPGAIDPRAGGCRPGKRHVEAGRDCLGAGEALDQETRPAVRGEIKRRDWLKQQAEGREDWMLFEEDANWF